MYYPFAYEIIYLGKLDVKKRWHSFMLYLALVTSIAASIFLSLMLQMLSYFKFIKWNPIGFAERYGILEESHAIVHWLFLAIMIFLTSFILYLIMQYVYNVPAFITSLVIGVILAIMTEWIIYDLPAELSSFKKLSIPFMVIIVISARFLFETASFHYKAHLERNKLPYKESVIK